MAEGSKNSRYLASKDESKVGFSFLYPSQTTARVIKGSEGEASYQQKSQISYGNKQSGSYGKATSVETSFSGDFRWKNGTTGVKDEHKKSETVRVGDHQGYTEVYHEERFRRVTFDKSSGSNNIVPSEKYRGENTFKPSDHKDSESEYESESDQSEYEYESESDCDHGYHVCSYSYDSDSDY